MKNVDIDQIKNRQLYKMPEAFFDEIQEKVLKRTVFQTEAMPITQPKTPLKKWLFAAAACLAVISGSVFISQPDYKEKSSVSASHTSAASTPSQSLKVLPQQHESKTRTLVEPRFGDNASQGHQEYVSFNNKANHNSRASDPSNDLPVVIKPQSGEKQAYISKTADTETKIDVLLASFSPEELALLAQNAEQDVYLDLYN